MKVLVACEYGGRVRDAFIKRGHEATSCDLLPTDVPGPHYQGDVRDILNNGWDLMIAHPECTYMCSSGLHWNNKTPGRAEKTAESLDFVRLLMAANIPRWAIENPIGCISSQIREPDQFIQPYQYGEDASKRTCLWTKNLPQLQPTKYVPPRWVCCKKESTGSRPEYHVLGVSMTRLSNCPACGGKKKALPRWGNQTDSGQNKLGPSEDRWKIRSLTYQGWADAWAEQWGSLPALS